jgi:hypothetical protein
VKRVALGPPTCDPGLREIRLRRQHQRIWLVWGHLFSRLPASTRDAYRAHLATIGRRVDGIRTTGAGADLYDLTLPPQDPGRRSPQLHTPATQCMAILSL